MEWYHWLIIVSMFVFGVKTGIKISSLIPNGQSIRWQELPKGYYKILAIEPGWRRCALIQEELLLYEPLSVRLPREKGIELKPDDDFEISSQNGRPVFLLEKKEQPPKEIFQQ